MSDSTTNVNDTTEQPVPEQKVAIQLNVRDLNLVMAALQELPHRAVDALLRDILAQAQSQLQGNPAS